MTEKAKVDPRWHQLTNAMSNRERQIWARAGYPGLRKKEFLQLATLYPEIAKRIGFKFE